MKGEYSLLGNTCCAKISRRAIEIRNVSFASDVDGGKMNKYVSDRTVKAAFAEKGGARSASSSFCASRCIITTENRRNPIVDSERHRVLNISQSYFLLCQARKRRLFLLTVKNNASRIFKHSPSSSKRDTKHEPPHARTMPLILQTEGCSLQHLKSIIVAYKPRLFEFYSY